MSRPPDRIGSTLPPRPQRHAVEFGGKHPIEPYEPWIAVDPFRGGVRVHITGPHGFERTISFAADEQPQEITSCIKGTLEN